GLAQRIFRVATSEAVAVLCLLGSLLVLVWGLRTNTHKPVQPAPVPVVVTPSGPGRLNITVTRGALCAADAAPCSAPSSADTASAAQGVGAALVSVWSEREPGQYVLTARSE